MYIAPDTIIRILKDVPLDATYEHTLYWSTLASQRDYFIGKTKYLFQNQSYQRVNKGRLRIERKAEDLYDCNYLMFQNSAFGNKWFYAFITGVNYVNNITSEIEYELDVMSTWFFDYEIKQCFVEREHSLTDNVGDNLMPEPVALGDYVYSQYAPSGLFNDWVIVLATTSKVGAGVITDAPADGVLIGNNAQFLDYTLFELTDAGLQQFKSAVNNIFTLILNGRDYVANVFLMPRAMAQATQNRTSPNVFTSTAPYNTTSYGNQGDRWYYKPRNNKLLTFPYNYLEVNNMQGSVAKFKFERFGSHTPTFSVCADYSASPSITFIAENYMNGGNVANPDSVITVPSLPVVCFSATDLTAKLVQLGMFVTACAVGAGVGLTTASTAVGAEVGMAEASGAEAGALMKTDALAKSNVTRTATTTTKFTPLATQSDVNELGNVQRLVGSGASPYTSHTGQLGTPNALMNLNMFDVVYTIKHITPEYARMIDDFFDRYGYATRRNKVPNRNARPHWSYVKTATCTIDGSIPSDDERKICNIYNRGITFWIHGDEVGDYTLDNSPS